MAVVFRNAHIVTLDEAGTVHHAAALAVEDGRIADIGDNEAVAARHPGAETVEARGKAVLPGLANIHTHFSMILAKGVFEDLSPPHAPPFEGGLSPIPMPELEPEELRTMCALAAIEAIRSGTTAVIEDGTGIDTYADIVADSGLRVLFCERAWDRVGASIGDPSPFEQDRRLGGTTLQRIADLHTAWDGAADGRIKVGAAAWAPDMCSPDLLRELRCLQDRLGCVATIHLNQIWGEVAAVKAHRGRLPTEYLDDVGFLSDRLICAHCRCMDPSEEKTLGRCNCHVAFNSAIAARRGLSPRIADLDAYGSGIGMGSDNMSEDMLEVVRTGLFMERVRRRDGRNPSPEQALRWATSGGYRAMGMADGGSLAVGNKADLIVVDLERASLVPVLRVASCLVHQGQPADVEAVMVDGRWVMRDGVIAGLDEPRIVREAQAVAERAWARLFDTRPDLVPPPGFVPGGRGARAAAELS